MTLPAKYFPLPKRLPMHKLHMRYGLVQKLVVDRDHQGYVTVLGVARRPRVREPEAAVCQVGTLLDHWVNH